MRGEGERARKAGGELAERAMRERERESARGSNGGGLCFRDVSDGMWIIVGAHRLDVIDGLDWTFGERGLRVACERVCILCVENEMRDTHTVRADDER